MAAFTRLIEGGQNGQKNIPLKFSIAASSVPTLILGTGVTVTKLATGKIAVDLDRAYPRVFAVNVSKGKSGAAAPVDAQLTWDDALVPTTGRLVIWTALGAAPGTAADVAAATLVSVEIVVSISDVG